MSEALLLGFEITASIGYVMADNPEKDLNEYINDADARMYVKKRERHALDGKTEE
jgi:GGDEF domain-containing protein